MRLMDECVAKDFLKKGESQITETTILQLD